MAEDYNNILKHLPPDAYSRTDPLLIGVLEAMDLINEYGRGAIRILIRDQFSDEAQGAGLAIVAQNRGLGVTGLDDNRLAALIQAWFAGQRPNVSAMKDVCTAFLGYEPTITEGSGAGGPGARVIQIDIPASTDNGAPQHALYFGFAPGGTWTDDPWTYSFSNYPPESGVFGWTGAHDYFWAAVTTDMEWLLDQMKIAGHRIDYV